MEPSRGRRLRAGMLTTALATVVTLVALAPPVAAKTTVSVKKSVVTIHIDVDVYGAEGLTGPDGKTSLIDYWKQVLQNTWGAAFDRLPYKNCLKFELDLDLRPRSRDAKDRNGRDRIHVTAPRTGGNWDGVGWEGTEERARNRTTGDGTRAFENDRSGTIPANAPPTIIAHEFGHVFGLGDDRKNGKAKNGRDGTLMVGGAEGVDPNQPLEIDQELVDRLGKNIERAIEHGFANDGEPLPKCETWKGTSRGRTVGAGSCSPIEHSGTIELAVAPDGTVTGSITSTASPYTCGPAQLPGATGTAALTGTRTDEAIVLTGELYDIELQVSGDRASGTTDLTGYADTLTTLEIELQCTDCEGEAVG